MSSEQIPPEDREPDPARCYERAKPEKEAGMGRLDNNDDAVPAARPDSAARAIHNSHRPHQINAEDEIAGVRRDRASGGAAPEEEVEGGVDHSMLEEEAMGEDQMPTDIHDPQAKRHPRTEGRGGLE